jgi:hypothetical protein
MKTRQRFNVFAVALIIGLTLPMVSKSQGGGLEDRPKAKERIEQLKKIRLIDVLELDESGAEKFFARYNQLQKKVEEARAILQEAVADLERNVQSKSGKDYVRKADLVIDKQAALANAISDKLRAMKTILTEEQYGKFIVFESNFAAQLQKMILEHKQQKKMDTDK